MKGSSGARLGFQGDVIRKECSDAAEQAEWFEIARNLPVMPGVRVPHTPRCGEGWYEIEYIEGTCGTHSASTLIIDTLLDQVTAWRDCASHRDADWYQYVHRLAVQHIQNQDTISPMTEAFNLVSQEPPLPASFAHGDLTLENIIIDRNGDLVLIDPNFKRDLFQSYVLDLGKLLQSVHSDYHRVFDSHPGVDLRPHCEVLMNRLSDANLLRPALVAEITHVMRLRKYRPADQRPKVDELLQRLLHEIHTV